MKIVTKALKDTSDVSSARGTGWQEFWKLSLSATLLLIVFYFSIGFLVDLMIPWISFETEEKIFNSIELPGIEIPKSENQDNLEKAQAILNTLKKGKMVPPLSYHLLILEQDEPNAFAFPGGGIGLTTGLLDQLDDEIEIAFVLGHELGHFYHRDHLKGLGRAAGFGIIMAVIFSSGSGAESFGSIINIVLQRNYSQEREMLADRFGLEQVYSAYGKTQGMDHLFKILHENSALPGWAYMFSTHPSPQSRINDLETYAKQLKR